MDTNKFWETFGKVISNGIALDKDCNSYFYNGWVAHRLASRLEYENKLYSVSNGKVIEETVKEHDDTIHDRKMRLGGIIKAMGNFDYSKMFTEKYLKLEDAIFGYLREVGDTSIIDYVLSGDIDKDTETAINCLAVDEFRHKSSFIVLFGDSIVDVDDALCTRWVSLVSKLVTGENSISLVNKPLEYKKTLFTFVYTAYAAMIKVNRSEYTDDIVSFITSSEDVTYVSEDWLLDDDFNIILLIFVTLCKTELKHYQYIYKGKGVSD